MLYLLLTPFILQALLIFFDEGVFHLKRGLPKWERIGHPIDTLSVLACLVFVLLTPFSKTALWVYISLCSISCILITKDEFVHKHVCNAKEQWLHAALFVNHSILLISCALIWIAVSAYPSASWISELSTNKNVLLLFLRGQAIFIFLFAIYQIIYWNFIWKEKKKV